MPLQATSGAASYDAFGGGVAVVPNYIEDVFSTWLYTGNGGTQTITNGIDLAGEGGLVWQKMRSDTASHILVDTVRGTGNFLSSNSTSAQTYNASVVSSFNSNGFTDAGSQASGATYASWTFRKQPKFFDVVTYTGTGSQQSINHNLGSVPGCIIVKRTDATSSYWGVYHRSLTDGFTFGLNTTEAAFSAPSFFVNSASQTSTQFTVGTSANVNASGGTYVAYLFAHNAGGFGLSGTDNVISCGSFTFSGSTVDVNLGYEPQFLLVKASSTTGDWQLFDNMRGMPTGGNDARLFPNTSGAENTSDNRIDLTATGFTATANLGSSPDSFIYIAIRRGPMKVPTTGTSVYNAVTANAPSTPTTITFNTGLSGGDLGWGTNLNNANRAFGGTAVFDRLRGAVYLFTNLADAEGASAGQGFSGQNSWIRSFGSGDVVGHFFKRAPGFFDEVCYTGTGSTRTVTHNLTVAPEFMIIKCRSNADNWPTYAAPLGPTNMTWFNLDSATNSGVTNWWNNTAPTSSVFTVRSDSSVNSSGQTYVAYLFASVPGVSKVGSYTGTGTTQTIDCGFTAGSRFVMIKRTDSTGDWYLYDSARGIVSGNDPYMLLNSNAAQVTSTDYVDTAATGFELSNTAPAALNASGGTYIFLAIA